MRRFRTSARAPGWMRLVRLAVAVLTAAAMSVTAQAAAAPAASLTHVTNFGNNPSNLQMYEYVPDNVPQHPAVLLALHGCTGSGPQFFSATEFRSLADRYGFIVVYPSVTRSYDCWDVSSPSSLTHNGNNDPAGLVSMIQYVEQHDNADASRVYVTGGSSGAMMTNVLLGDYPDVFKAGAAFMGVPFGCFATTDGSQWNARCAQGQLSKTPQQWGDLVRGAYPGYSGPRPRMQLWHGTADTTLYYPNLGEEIKQWTNVFGLSQTPTSTDTPQSGWTRNRYADGSGNVDVEAYSIAGAGHALPQNGMAANAIHFFGLDGGGSQPAGGGLHAVGAGKCLDSSTTAGTQVQIQDCNGGASQAWTHTASNQLTVSSGGSTMCLDANGKGTSPGTKAVVWSCNGQANQQWEVNVNGTVTGVQSGLCLDVSGGSTASGALVQLWTCNGGSNQQWTLSDGGGGNPGGGALPSSFRWSSSGVLIGPKSDAGHNLLAVKDADAVTYNGRWYVFASTVSSAGSYGMETLNFTDWSQAANATQYYLDQSGIGGGYRAAPEIFYFVPQHLWYLVYQTGNASYSTNPDISNPAGWTAPRNFYPGVPSIIQQNIGNGYWVDMSVTCDSANCYLFSSDDNGHLYRSQTSLADFPNGMSQPVIAMQDSNPYNLFEASHVYTVAGTNTYLLMVEAIGSNGRRYFRSWTSNDIGGSWAPLAATEGNPLAGPSNVTFSGTPWTQDISHGDLIRSGYDQTLSISPCHLQFLYQGKDPNAGGDYNHLPWRLGLLTQTNSTC